MLVSNPIHDFLHMQQNPTQFSQQFLINAQNGPFPFPWPPVGMPPQFPPMFTALQNPPSFATTNNKQVLQQQHQLTKTNQENESNNKAKKQQDNDDDKDDNKQKKNNTTAITTAEGQNKPATPNDKGLSSDNFQTKSTANNNNANTFGSVSNGKKTSTKLMPTDEQLEHRSRYLQQMQQLNQFNAFNALQNNGAAYSAYAAALSLQNNSEYQTWQFGNNSNNNNNIAASIPITNNGFMQRQQYQNHEQQQPQPTQVMKKGKQPSSSQQKSPNNRNRMIWNDELHKRFMVAVNQLGLDSAVPKTIMQMMDVQGLTRENVASHLQKYRMKQMSAEKRYKDLSQSTLEDSNFMGVEMSDGGGGGEYDEDGDIKRAGKRPAENDDDDDDPTINATKNKKKKENAIVAKQNIVVISDPEVHVLPNEAATAKKEGRDSGQSSGPDGDGINSAGGVAGAGGGENNSKRFNNLRRGKSMSSEDEENSDKDDFEK